MTNKLLEKLIEREKGDEAAAHYIFDEIIQRIRNGENPEEVLWEENLEPDYIINLLT